MSTNRNLCTRLTQSGSHCAQIFAGGLRRSFSAIYSTASVFTCAEVRSGLVPMVIGASVGAFFAIPSATYAVLTKSELPSYTLAGTAVGSAVSVCYNLYKLMTFKPVTIEEILADEKKSTAENGYVNLINLQGQIAVKLDFSADKLRPLLKQAFEDKSAKGVVLKINSGGGAPVQSAIIYREILRLKKLHNKKIVVVGEDLLASGAYYVAAAADKIYVNANTLTGSIGVAAEGFGLADLAKKLGVEARTYTAGTHKRRHNPFKPEKKEDVAKLESDLKEVHEDFINAILEARKDKLKEAPEKLFTGDVWYGKRAMTLGLVDEIGDLADVLEKEFQVTRYKECAAKFWQRFFDSDGAARILHHGVSVSLNLEGEAAPVQMKYRRL